MKISKSIDENLSYIKERMAIPLSVDSILREFTINTGDSRIRAFLVYYEGTTKGTQIDAYIMQSLHLIPRDDTVENLADLIEHQLISRNQLVRIDDMDKMMDMVNYGGCAVFIDTLDVVFVADVKGWDTRGVDQPTAEAVIRGPQEGFNEVIRTNTGLLRKIIRNENMICEAFEVGKQSHTGCNLIYIKNVVNEQLLAEARRRLEQIEVDYIFDSGELEQLLEGFTFFPTPQILSTERPDRVAHNLADGKIAILLDGSPFALVLPINSFELTHTSEDQYLRYPYANLMRLMRVFAMLTALLLPGIFIAVVNYHHEAVPTHLLFAIGSTQEKVPFSIIFEILLLEVAFEFVREACVRVPSTVGQTLGIVGGLVIGQAAVEANIVSPIVIIIIALTAIGSFATPNYFLGFSFRILKYWYIILGAIGGFLGISVGLFLHLAVMCNTQSFGIPFMAPLAPKYSQSGMGTFFVKPIWKREKRQGFLHPQKQDLQPSISRKWAVGDDSTLLEVEDETEVK